MLNIIISSNASHYIRSAMENLPKTQSQKGTPVIKLFHRSYVTTDDGTVIEHGPVLHVTLIDEEELKQDEYFVGIMNDGNKILIHPVKRLDQNEYMIDIIKGRLNIIENI